MTKNASTNTIVKIQRLNELVQRGRKVERLNLVMGALS